MLLYYAHAMCLYGTAEESAEIAAIARSLPWCEIVNPSTLRCDTDEGESMRYFLRVAGCCDGLVFSRLLGRVTAGVGLEVNHALATHLPVYELEGGLVFRVVLPVEFLSREETLRQYAVWRTLGRKVA